MIRDYDDWVTVYNHKLYYFTKNLIISRKINFIQFPQLYIVLHLFDFQQNLRKIVTSIVQNGMNFEKINVLLQKNKISKKTITTVAIFTTFLYNKVKNVADFSHFWWKFRNIFSQGERLATFSQGEKCCDSCPASTYCTFATICNPCHNFTFCYPHLS